MATRPLMGWVRMHRRFAAVAALFALLAQLGLSFGHMHPAVVAPISIAATTADSASTSQPNTGHPHDDADYCAICAILALLGGAQAPTAPVLAPRPAPASTAIAAAVAPVRQATPHVAFRSRAPPLS